MILNLHFCTIVIIHKENIFLLANMFSFLLPHPLAAIIIFIFHEFDLLKFSHISITTECLPQCICHILLNMLFSNSSMLLQMSKFPNFLKVNYISQQYAYTKFSFYIHPPLEMSVSWLFKQYENGHRIRLFYHYFEYIQKYSP